MMRVPFSGKRKSLCASPSAGAEQSGLVVTTATTWALSKLKLLSVSRPGDGSGVHGPSKGGSEATCVGGGAGGAAGDAIGAGGGGVRATGGGGDGTSATGG